ncbi:DUF3515 domain-containing protein [Enemella sp. A6]|uniref:DUF3515 domain-containing protein n=1 Tax=Enemella sp. A6 TaxID=3440152 RepID=UPI003EB711C1
MRRPRIVAGLLLTAALAGCAAPVSIDDPAPTGEVAEICTAVVAEMPDELLGAVSRETSSQWGRAWGDPPITLVCGVAKPPELTPTSPCLEINGVGWFEQQGSGGGTVWTTIGRPAVIRVGVPAEYGDPISPLADLSVPIGAHNPVQQPCVG